MKILSQIGKKNQSQKDDEAVIGLTAVLFDPVEINGDTRVK